MPYFHETFLFKLLYGVALRPCREQFVFFNFWSEPLLDDIAAQFAGFVLDMLFPPLNFQINEWLHTSLFSFSFLPA